MAMRGIVRDLVGILTLKGGPGSGHRGHAGRPGSVGGSVPGTGNGTISPVGYEDDYGNIIEVYSVKYGDKLPDSIINAKEMTFALDSKGILHVSTPLVESHAELAYIMDVPGTEYDKWVRGIRHPKLGEGFTLVVDTAYRGALSRFSRRWFPEDAEAAAEAIKNLNRLSRSMRSAGFPDDQLLQWDNNRGSDIVLPLSEWKEYVIGILTLKGGPGSGHRGHAGRPGSVGGSAPGVGLQYSPASVSVSSAKQFAETKIEEEAFHRGMTSQEVKEDVMARLDKDLKRPISIRRGWRGTQSILDEGRFKTQHETGTSGGYFDPESRANAENKGLGTPLDIADSQRPVYGYFSTDQHRAAQYGAIEFVLKDSVKNRTTYTIGDSLGAFTTRRLVGRQKSSDIEAWDGQISSYLRRGAIGVMYIEAQIQGGVRLSDVAKVVLHSSGRSAREHRALVKSMEAKGLDVEIV